MTDPLIDRRRLTSIIFWGGDQEDTADRVLAYLREVLTPEALDSYGTGDPDLHRRIFGEEPAPPEASKPSRVVWGTRGSAS